MSHYGLVCHHWYHDPKLDFPLSPCHPFSDSLHDQSGQTCHLGQRWQSMKQSFPSGYLGSSLHLSCEQQALLSASYLLHAPVGSGQDLCRRSCRPHSSTKLRCQSQKFLFDPNTSKGDYQQPIFKCLTHHFFSKQQASCFARSSNKLLSDSLTL